MAVAGTEGLICLHDGYVIRTSVYDWLIAASFRLTFRVSDGALDVWPSRAITEADDRFIRQHRDELIAAVTYCDRQAETPL